MMRRQLPNLLLVVALAPVLSGCVVETLAINAAIGAIGPVTSMSQQAYNSVTSSSSSSSPQTIYCLDDKLSVAYIRVSANCSRGDRVITEAQFNEHRRKVASTPSATPTPAVSTQALAGSRPSMPAIYCYDDKLKLAYATAKCVAGDRQITSSQYADLKKVYCFSQSDGRYYISDTIICVSGVQISKDEYDARRLTPPTAIGAAPAPPPRVTPASPSPSVASTPPPSPPPPRDLVTKIQTLLNAVGYDVGRPDGAVGKKTREAIKDFQSRAKVEVTGEPSEALLGQLQIVVAAVRDTKKPEPVKLALSSTGTGIIIGTDGKILTNHHVIDECRDLRVRHQDISESKAALLAADARNDLALISVRASGLSAAKFRTGQFVRQGEDVVAYGFPLRGVLASGAGMTTGIVSALAGMGDDSRRLQITAPVQPGNSGGPLLDQSGNVVGVIDSKLNAIKVARVTGDIPQNINFAIKGPVAQTFLDSTQATYATTVDTAKIATVDIADRARKFTVLVECWK